MQTIGIKSQLHLKKKTYPSSSLPNQLSQKSFLSNQSKKTVDGFVYSNKEKSNLIAEAFLTVHTISDNITCQSFKVNDSLAQVAAMTVDFPFIERVRLNEIQDLIKSLNIKKACGYDKISNRLIENAIILFMKFFYSCLSFGYFPSAWKISKVIAFPKPGKNHCIPSSYRPITLLPVIGKMFEKIVLERMTDFEKENKILINQQFGFRSKHSTTQQIMRMVEFISYRFNLNKLTAVAMIDIKKGFDSVWHDGLVHKLKTYNFISFLIKIVASFLIDRLSYVSINNFIAVPLKVLHFLLTSSIFLLTIFRFPNTAKQLSLLTTLIFHLQFLIMRFLLWLVEWKRVQQRSKSISIL